MIVTFAVKHQVVVSLDPDLKRQVDELIKIFQPVNVDALDNAVCENTKATSDLAKA